MQPINLSDYELINIVKNNPGEVDKIRQLFQHGILEITNELNRLEAIFAGFTQRAGVLLTLAGLLSFLPALSQPKETYFSNFLIWTFPFLLLAIIFFYFFGKRVTVVKTQFISIMKGADEELVVLKAEILSLRDIWQRQYNIYNRIKTLYNFSSTFVYIYLISLSTNYYLFYFLKEGITIWVNIILFMAVLILGSSIVLRLKNKSFTKSFGPSIEELRIKRSTVPIN